jgi:hypothetical protein
MSHIAPPLAFGWLEPSMLGWIAAAAAPILLHLRRRRDFRETPWAAVDFLLAAARRQARRLRVRQRALLLLRVALIAIFAAALAQPYLGSAAAPPAGRTHRLLMLDDSFSMSYQGGGASLFEQAKEIARRIIRQSAPDDVFTLALMSAPPRVAAGPTADAESAIRRLDALGLSQTKADLPAAVALALNQMTPDGGQRRPYARQEVYFISDMQRATWAPELAANKRTEFQQSSKKLAEAASVIVVEVGRSNEANLAVVDLRAANPPAAVGCETVLRAELKNFGSKTLPNQPVELWIDGRRADRKLADITPGQSAVVEFRPRFESPGEYAVEVRAEGDALPLDNRRYLALSVGRPIRVLSVDGRSAAERFGGAADYVAAALSANDAAAQVPVIRIEATSGDDMQQRDWNDYDCVVFCDVPQFTAAEVRRIENYLRDGGGVVFILGPGVRADRYNAELGPTGQGRAGGAAILPVRIGPLRERTARLDPLDCRHPLLAAFREKGQASLSAALAFKYFSLELPESSSSRAMVAIALEDGQPLLLAWPVGDGRAALLAAAAEPSWTSLPLGPGFLPLMRELVAWCAAGRITPRGAMVGQPLRMRLPSAAANTPARLELPGGRARRILPLTDDDSTAVVFSETDQAGFYILRYGTAADQKAVFAVNLDVSESDPRRISPRQLPEQTWAEVPFRLQSDGGGETTLGSPSVRLPLHVALLYVVLGLLLADSFLARTNRPLP